MTCGQYCFAYNNHIAVWTKCCGGYDERQWSDEPIKDFRWLCIEEDGKKIQETKTLTLKGSLF